MERFNNSWDKIISPEIQKPYFKMIKTHLENEALNHVRVFPPKENIFEAFKSVDFDDVKIVILGQDPYHEWGQAHGLSFSVLPGVKIPPSLRNIYKELHSDIGFTIPNHGYLMDWAKQGVLLLNTILTVQEGVAHAHKNIGWETFTDHIITELGQRKDPIVFMLWGKHAQKKASLIDQTRHLCIETAHPSPLSASRGFLGSRPFSQANAFLVEKGIAPISWNLPSNIV